MPARAGSRGRRNDYGKGAAARKPRRSVGAAVQKAGGRKAGWDRPPKRANLRTPPKNVRGDVKAGTYKRRTAPPKQVKSTAASAVQTGTTAQQAATVKALRTVRQRQQAVRSITREQAREDRKAARRSVIAGAPIPTSRLRNVQGGLSKFFLGDTTPPGTTAAQRAKLDQMVRRGQISGRARSQILRGAEDPVGRADAAALKVLNQTTRVTRGLAGATRETVKGRPGKAPGALAKGVTKNKGPLFGDVLREAGVPKGAAAVVGFGLDVGTDPTTYLTLGTGSVAKKTAQTAAVAAAEKAAKAGMSKAGQETVARAAAKKAAAAAPKGSGITVKFAGKEAPGIRRATASVGRKANLRTPGKVRTVGRQVNPRISPEDVSREQFSAMKQTERQARSTRAQARRRATDKGRLTAANLTPAQYAQVIDAIERRKIGKLPAELRPVAQRVRDDFRHELRLRRRAGVATGDITKAKSGAMGYVPHVSEDVVGTKSKKAVGQRTVRPASSRTRKDRRPISEINTERSWLKNSGEAPYSTNLPTLQADYIARSGNARAQAQVARGLVKQGRDIAKDVQSQIARAKRQGHGATPKVTLKDGESVYHVGGVTGTAKDTGRGIRKVDTDSPEFEQLLKSGTTKEGGRYVVLPDSLVEEAYRNLGTDRTVIGAGFDKAMGGWKGIATATPGFHIRNMIGDTQMAYLGQRGHRMPTNVRAASRALGEQTRRDVAQKTSMRPAKGSDKTVKLAGKTVPVSQFVDELMQHGVLRSGQRGRELEDLLSGTGASRVKDQSTRRAKVRGKASRAWGPVERLMQNREDLMRAATYKEARDRGLSPAEAADWSMKHHIDYGDLTEAERVFARRAAPFYTFSARAIPLHVQRLVTNPGKFATIEKARQETAGAFGMGQDWEKDLPEYKQRAIPFGVKIGGNPMALDAQLPINTLNELPGTMKPGEQLGEWGQFLAGLATPAGKIPVELLANRSFFFRKDIQSAELPLVSAPGWAGALPKGVQKTLGVTKIKDRRTGKMVLGWPGRTDYIARQVPGMAALLNSLSTEGAGRSGRAGWEKWASTTGVKFDPVDANTTRIFRLFEDEAKLKTQLAALRQQGRGGGRNSTDPKVRALSKQIRAIDEQIYSLSVKRGDAAPYRENAVGKRKAAMLRSKATGARPKQTDPLAALDAKLSEQTQSQDVEKVLADLDRQLQGVK